MFCITFTPHPDYGYADFFAELPPEKKETLNLMLVSTVMEVSWPQSTKCEAQWLPGMVLVVTMNGVAPLDQRVADSYVQYISSLLEANNVCFYFVSEAFFKKQANDTILTTPPCKQKVCSYGAEILSILRPDITVPDQFMCPITHELMQEPVRIHPDCRGYDRQALIKWIGEKGTDPFTRKLVRVSDIVPDDLLQDKIRCFVRAVVMRKDLKPFFMPDTKTEHLESSAVKTGLFAQPAAALAPVEPVSLASVLAECCLTEELEGLLARALGRAASVGDVVLMEKIFSQVLPERANNIANRSGLTPDFQKTPLQLAVQQGHVHAARCLLGHGADPDKVNADGTTCRQLITESSNPEIQSLLGVTTAVTPS